MIIYKTTNLLNNKIYIGKDEKNYPKYLGSGKLLKLAIKKYGIENFKKETIDTANDREELNNKEKYWIKYFNSTKDGYNLTDGGTGGVTSTISIFQYDLNGNFIKKWNSIKLASFSLNIGYDNIRSVLRGLSKSTGGFMWSKTFKGKKIPKYSNNVYRRFLQYDKNGNFIKEWESYIEVCKIFNPIHTYTIDNMRRTHKGFIWLRKKTNEIEEKIIIPQKQKNKKKR